MTLYFHLRVDIICMYNVYVHVLCAMCDMCMCMCTTCHMWFSVVVKYRPEQVLGGIPLGLGLVVNF